MQCSVQYSTVHYIAVNTEVQYRGEYCTFRCNYALTCITDNMFLCSAPSKIYTVGIPWSLKDVHSTLCRSHCLQYTVHSTLHSVHCKLYKTVYAVHCTLYTVQSVDGGIACFFLETYTCNTQTLTFESLQPPSHVPVPVFFFFILEITFLKHMKNKPNFWDSKLGFIITPYVPTLHR